MDERLPNLLGQPALLVSVRDAREAEIAVAAHADWVDAKNPAKGSLGAVELMTLAEIIQACSKTWPTPVSAALGELVDVPTIPQLQGLSLVKLGLAHTGDDIENIRKMLADWLDAVRPGDDNNDAMPGVIIASYADHREVDAPRPRDVLDIVVSLKDKGVAGMLIDTAIKNGRTLLDHMLANELADIIEICRSNDLLIALAGSLTPGAVSEVTKLQPDVIAVRSAACSDFNRNGSIDKSRVALLKASIRSTTESLDARAMHRKYTMWRSGL